MKEIKYPTLIDKNTKEILPVFSILYDENGKAIEAEVWLHDDIFLLEEGEFELV
jgi:hypothetical protein